MNTLNIGALIIGDEIIRGKRHDKHFDHLVETLATRGLRLAWSMVLGDNRQRLTETLRRTLASDDVVFSFGGIGITPDDHTRHAAAAAAGVALQLHADAEREIRARCTEQAVEVSAQRLQLGEFPVGSRIVPNPINRMPGFSLHDHHFYPGFPQMAWPMMEWVLDHKYRHLHHCVAWVEDSLAVYEAHESRVVDLMERLEARYGVTVFSLPHLGSESLRTHIELGAKGAPEAVSQAMAEMREELSRRGCAWGEMCNLTR